MDAELFKTADAIQVYESSVMDAEGGLHDVIFHKAAITNSHGEINGLVGAVLDITERKQIEETLKLNEEKYRLIFEHAPVGLLHINTQGTISDCNDKMVEILGSSREALVGLNMSTLLDTAIKDALKTALCGSIATHEGLYRSVTAGKIAYVRVIFAPIKTDSEKIIGAVGIVEDISERKALETELFNEKKLFETTLKSVGDGVISTDNDGRVVFMNKIAEKLTGWSIEDAKGRDIEEIFNIIDELTLEKRENIVTRVLKHKKILALQNHTLLISKDSIARPIEDSAAPITEENGNIIGTVIVFRDYSDKKQKQEKIRYLSYHDQLTGLHNRRFYEEQLKRINIKENLPISIAMGDVNGLKLTNDSFGHLAGDMLLIKIANVLKQASPENHIIARFGGDEFVIVMPKTSAEESEKIMNSIRRLASREYVGSIAVSISFGYATKLDEDEKIEAVFKKAEDQMYNKKLYESPSIRGKTINAIISALYEKNQREEQHSHRVSELCRRMAIALHMTDNRIEELKTMGLLHDIGKIAIDENILNKPAKLSADEWKEIQRHPEIGYRILSTVNDMSELASSVLSHHERWDGKGYPKGLKGNEIPFASRIITIADSFDAMTSERSYRAALPESFAVSELRRNSGTQFDPELVEIFIAMVTNKNDT